MSGTLTRESFKEEEEKNKNKNKRIISVANVGVIGKCSQNFNRNSVYER